MSPYKLVYGKACYLLVELEHGALWEMNLLNFDHKTAGKQIILQLNELDEFCQDAFENVRIYKEKTKAWNDKHIVSKDINPG